MKTTILFGVLFLSLLLAVVVVIDLVRIPNIYEVTGTGEVTYSPDLAKIVIGVVERADVSDDASQQTAQSMAKVIDALKADGIADADINATGLSSQPTQQTYYGNGSSQTKLPAYTATQTIIVIVRDFPRLGALASAVSSAGANSWNVTFEADDKARQDAGNAARKAALDNAIGIADSYASDGGFGRGRILKLLGNNVNFPEANFEERDYELSNAGGYQVANAITNVTEAIATAGKPPIPATYVIPKPEPLTANASVDVLFEIK